MIELPQMTHLTEEERLVIEDVVRRQRREEEKDNEILRMQQAELDVLEDNIQKRVLVQKMTGAPLDATCHICLKTKFADGVGHSCHSCGIKCCAKCGIKVKIKNSKEVWMCIVCQKKQQIYITSGMWLNKGKTGSQGPATSTTMQGEARQQPQLPRQGESRQQPQSSRPGERQQPLAPRQGESRQLPPTRQGDFRHPGGRLYPDSQERPRLERTQSATERELSTFERSNSQLRRQYSHQEQSTRSPSHSIQQEEDPGYYRDELEDLMRSAPYYNRSARDVDYRSDQEIDYDRRKVYADSSSRSMDYRGSIEPSRTADYDRLSESTGAVRKQTGLGSRQHSHRRYDSSDEDPDGERRLLSRDEEKDLEWVFVRRPGQPKRNLERRNGMYQSRAYSSNVKDYAIRSQYYKNRHSFENIYPGDECCEEYYNPSEQGRRHSISSDYVGEYDEIRQRTECLRSPQSESENHWYWPHHYRYRELMRGLTYPKEDYDDETDYSDATTRGSRYSMGGYGRRISKKKTVRFDKRTNMNEREHEIWLTMDNLAWFESGREESEELDTETSSNIASSDDTKKGRPKYPPSWEINEDGTYVIGRVTLSRTRDPSTKSLPVLGLKVEADRMLDGGIRGAVIEKVKKGSVADVEGQLRPGDEVVEWNGHPFRGASKQEVNKIITGSRDDYRVELIVCRAIGPKKKETDDPRSREASQEYPESSMQMSPVSRRRDVADVSPREMPTPLRTPASGLYPTVKRIVANNDNVGGMMQVRLWFDVAAIQFMITVVCAKNLCPRRNGQARNPYARLLLLPEGRDNMIHRTQTLINTNNPYWNEAFFYNVLSEEDVRVRIVEITVWDYVRCGPNVFLGEVMLQTSMLCFDREPMWLKLSPHEELFPPFGSRGERSSRGDFIEVDDYSPTNVIGRAPGSDYSDSETARGRMMEDGATSIGDTASALPETERTGRRSRRDMSPTRERGRPMMTYRDRQPTYPQQQSGSPQRYYSGSASSPGGYHRTRSYSPRRVENLPLPDTRLYHSQTNVPRYGSRYVHFESDHPEAANSPRRAPFSKSATCTPTGSPRRRYLPQVPPVNYRVSHKEAMSQDVEDRAEYIRQRTAYVRRRYGNEGEEYEYEEEENRGGYSWDRQYVDEPSDFDHSVPENRSRDWTSPERGFADSDKESIISIRTGYNPQGYEDVASSSSGAGARYSGGRTVGGTSSLPRSGGVLSGSSGTGSLPRIGPSSSSNRTPTISKGGVSSSTGVIGKGNAGTGATGRVPTGPSAKDKNSRESPELGPKRGLSEKDIAKPEGSSKDSGDSSPSKKASGLPKTVPGKKEPQRPNERGLKYAASCLFRFARRRTSATQISATGRKRRLGFGRAEKTTFTVHRSEEVLPEDLRKFVRQGSSMSSDGEGSHEGDSWTTTFRPTEDANLLDFIDGLGPGQVVGRQVLGAPSMGDIHVNLALRGGRLEAEVVRVKGLQLRPGFKTQPAAYVKLYLINRGKVVEKLKTRTAKKSLSPAYEQKLLFREDYMNCILQVTVWGDYGRLEGKKVFLGVVQIMLDELNLPKQMVFGCYKLYGTSSLVSGPPYYGLTRRTSLASLVPRKE